MTDQQQTARIKFVKKLLVANGFLKCTTFNNWQLIFGKTVDFNHHTVEIVNDSICFARNKDFVFQLPHDKSLKPLRDFIKLSNYK